MRRWFGTAAACVACLLPLGVASAAQASVLSIGSVLPTTYTSGEFEQVKTLFNTALPEPGANLTSPVNGAIVRWRVQGAKGGPFFLRVLHPNGKGGYEAAGTSGPATPSGTGLETFSTNLPVHAGDLVGIDPSNATDEIGFSAVAGASYAYIFPPPFDGSVVPPSGNESGEEIELSAEVQPAPEVTSVAPSFGSVTGGTEVVITGKSLSGTSAVKFGDLPAATFTVDSDTQITATTPVSEKPGKVDVSVTTLAGSSADTTLDNFVYRACVVPKLRGRTLAVAKRQLRGAGCKLGRVKKVNARPAKHGKVLKQIPKAGKVLAPGAKVTVKVGA